MVPAVGAYRDLADVVDSHALAGSVPGRSTQVRQDTGLPQKGVGSPTDRKIPDDLGLVVDAVSRAATRGQLRDRTVIPHGSGARPTGEIGPPGHLAMVVDGIPKVHWERLREASEVGNRVTQEAAGFEHFTSQPCGRRASPPGRSACGTGFSEAVCRAEPHGVSPFRVICFMSMVPARRPSAGVSPGRELLRAATVRGRFRSTAPYRSRL